ncbi:MAG: esterase-like activity of phytase family protein [Burkholderiales bacterium]
MRLRHPIAIPFCRPALAIACALAFAAPASAQYTSSNRDVLAPNTGAWSATGVTLGGTTFRNLGLQGVGRFAASSIDAATGETLGSISDMQITNFVNNGNGSWSGRFHFLPDRGFNAGLIFSNYAARINTFDFTFTPYTGLAPTLAQNQIAMSFTGSTRFTYADAVTGGQAYTTGLLATATRSLFGTTAPASGVATTQSDGTLANRLTMDAEGLILDNRAGKAGSGWVGDEYGAYLYRFNSGKEIVGQLQLPAALIPNAPNGTINFAADPPTSGRRINQGMEGIAQSPDGTRVFSLLQSATLQDSAAGNVGRSNTRLVVYDVSGSDTPTTPIAQYVIQLPRVDDNGASGGVNVNRTGAQSAILALNNHQLLILSRDGNGRGANNGVPVFKSVLLADLSAATNINGSFDGTAAAVAPGGILNASVTPIAWTEALNMLGSLNGGNELARFNLNMLAANGNANTISEKWEALGMVPVGDGSGDYFLFVGNDNDFQSATGAYMNAAGLLQGYDAGLENDTMVLAYRVSAVPEPETWGMLMAGLCLIGSMARRARNRGPA